MLPVLGTLASSDFVQLLVMEDVRICRAAIWRIRTRVVL